MWLLVRESVVNEVAGQRIGRDIELARDVDRHRFDGKLDFEESDLLG